MPKTSAPSWCSISARSMRQIASRWWRFNRPRGISPESHGAAIARLADLFRDLPRLLRDLLECLVVILYDCLLAMMTDLATGSLSRRFQ
jgi:hypothetical protein